VNEALVVDDDADMQFLVRKMHEDQIAGAQFVAQHGHSRGQLFRRGTRHVKAGAIRRVGDQPAAVEAAGCGTSETIRLAEHGQGDIDHDCMNIRRRLRGAGCVRRVSRAWRADGFA